MRIIHEHLHELACLSRITRQNDVHAGEGAQYGDVVQTVVCCSQCSIGHTSAHAENLHGVLTVSHVHLYLLQASCHIEASRSAGEDLLSAVCQTGGDAHCVLLCDTTFHELFRQLVGKVVQRHRTACVCRNSDNILVLLCQFQQSVSKTLSTSYHSSKMCFKGS